MNKERWDGMYSRRRPYTRPGDDERRSADTGSRNRGEMGFSTRSKSDVEIGHTRHVNNLANERTRESLRRRTSRSGSPPFVQPNKDTISTRSPYDYRPNQEQEQEPRRNTPIRPPIREDREPVRQQGQVGALFFHSLPDEDREYAQPARSPPRPTSAKTQEEDNNNNPQETPSSWKWNQEDRFKAYSSPTKQFREVPEQTVTVMYGNVDNHNPEVAMSRREQKQFIDIRESEMRREEYKQFIEVTEDVTRTRKDFPKPKHYHKCKHHQKCRVPMICTTSSNADARITPQLLLKLADALNKKQCAAPREREQYPQSQPQNRCCNPTTEELIRTGSGSDAFLIPASPENPDQCPYCCKGVFVKRPSCLAYLAAVLLFPCGLYCLLSKKCCVVKKCNYCNAKDGRKKGKAASKAAVSGSMPSKRRKSSSSCFSWISLSGKPSTSTKKAKMKPESSMWANTQEYRHIHMESHHSILFERKREAEAFPYRPVEFPNQSQPRWIPIQPIDNYVDPCQVHDYSRDPDVRRYERVQAIQSLSLAREEAQAHNMYRETELESHQSLMFSRETFASQVVWKPQDSAARRLKRGAIAPSTRPTDFPTRRTTLKKLDPNQCPYCRVGYFEKRTTLMGYLTAVLCFPCGLYCCLKRKCCVVTKCNYCHAVADQDPKKLVEQCEEERREYYGDEDLRGSTSTTLEPSEKYLRTEPLTVTEIKSSQTVFESRHTFAQHPFEYGRTATAQSAWMSVRAQEYRETKVEGRQQPDSFYFRPYGRTMATQQLLSAQSGTPEGKSHRTFVLSNESSLGDDRFLRGGDTMPNRYRPKRDPFLCPYCQVGAFETRTSFLGYLTALLCFPCGLYCCLKKKCCVFHECNYCHAEVDTKRLARFPLAACSSESSANVAPVHRTPAEMSLAAEAESSVRESLEPLQQSRIDWSEVKTRASKHGSRNSFVSRYIRREPCILLLPDQHRCPYCDNGIFVKKTTPMGYLVAVLCFPCGLYPCLTKKCFAVEECNFCHARVGRDPGTMDARITQSLSETVMPAKRSESRVWEDETTLKEVPISRTEPLTAAQTQAILASRRTLTVSERKRLGCGALLSECQRSGRCPYCKRGKFEKRTTLTGYLVAVLCFPCGLYCCLNQKYFVVTECSFCHAVADVDPRLLVRDCCEEEQRLQYGYRDADARNNNNSRRLTNRNTSLYPRSTRLRR